MSLNLYSILKEIINESVSPNDVNHAIDNKKRVAIKYNDEGKGDGRGRAEGPRYIEPYVYGYTKAGNPCFRAYQYYGSTFRGTPKWKLFRLDRVESWEELEDTFKVEPRDNGWNAEKYNENGDKSMSSVENQVAFEGEEIYEPNAARRDSRNNGGPVFNTSLQNSLSDMIRRNMDITRKEKEETLKQKQRKQKKKIDVNDPYLHLGRGETWNSERATPLEGETQAQARKRVKKEKEQNKRNLDAQYEKELADIGFDNRPMFDNETEHEDNLNNQAEKLLHKK